MTEEKIVQVTNRNIGSTGYVLDNGRVVRTFEPKETKSVPLEELKMLQYTPGGEKMLKDYLIINDKSALEVLNMEVEPEYYYKEDDIKEILEKGSLDQLEDTLNFAPKGVIDILKRMAIDLELPDIRKRELIKEKTGFDINNAIMINQVLNTEEKDESIDEKIERIVKENQKKPGDAETTSTAPTRKYKVVSATK